MEFDIKENKQDWLCAFWSNNTEGLHFYEILIGPVWWTNQSNLEAVIYNVTVLENKATTEVTTIEGDRALVQEGSTKLSTELHTSATA